MIDSIYNSFSDYLSNNKENILENKKLIDIANKLNSLYDNNKIKVPQIVALGSQSSGKSSVLNSIVNMDILPTGKQMCTRCPIKLELTYSNSSNINIEIGYYDNYKFIQNNKYELLKNSKEEEEMIREHIEDFTLRYAGSEKNISYKEIIIRINSKETPNLTLIDLPGILCVAQTDLGQPDDIKEQIKDLIKHYIMQENTIIMGILAGRCDLEVDLALELIKECDSKNERSIGVLTKIDLMNENSDVMNYLNNEISNNLKLNFGYFAVKNKTNENINYIEHHKNEAEYFNNHNIYKHAEKSRIGTVNLSIELSNILLKEIKKNIPNLQIEISEKLNIINNQLEILGENIIIDENNMNFVINLNLNYFVENYNNTLENHSRYLNYGRQIKEIFIIYRNTLKNIDCLKNISNQKLENIIKDCEGNHMYYQLSTIEILEKCLLDNDLNIINMLKQPSLDCINNIYDLLIKILNNICKLDKLKNYKNLNKYILDKTIDLLLNYKTEIVSNLNYFIDIEKSYIWTESEEFKNIFNELDSLENNSITNIKKIIQMYFNTLVNTFENIIPKLIMYNIIKKSQYNLSTYLSNNLINENILYLLEEDDSISKKRIDLLNQKKYNFEIKQLLNDL